MILVGTSTPIPPTMRGLPSVVRLWLAMLLLLFTAVPVAPAQTILPGTNPFTFEGEPAVAMVEGIHAFLLRETAAPQERRAVLQRSDLAARREKFRRIIGAVDVRVPFTALQLTALTEVPAEVARAYGNRPAILSGGTESQLHGGCRNNPEYVFHRKLHLKTPAP